MRGGAMGPALCVPGWMPCPVYLAKWACAPGVSRVKGPLIHDLHRNLGDPAIRRTRGLPMMLKKEVMAMDAKELREKTPDQLRDELANLKKEAFNLRFQQATSQLENTSRMRSVRRDAARVKTILNEKAAQAAAE